MWDYLFTYFGGAILFILTLQLLKPMSFSENLAVLKASIQYAMGKVASYTVIFVIMILAFGAWAYVMLGSRLFGFSDMGHTFYNLFGKDMHFITL